MEVGGLHGRSHRLSHYRLLCRRLRLVPAICLCICLGRNQRRLHFRGTILSGVFQFCFPSSLMDRCHPCHHTPYYNKWCSKRDREGFQVIDAGTVHPVACHRGCFLSAAQCGEGNRIPFQARFR